MASTTNITNLLMLQGTDFSTTFEVLGDDGLPLDLTSYTARAQMRKHYYSNTAHDFECATFNGGVVITMNASTSSAVTEGRYVFDVELVDPYLVVTRPIKGQIKVDPEVTKSDDTTVGLTIQNFYVSRGAPDPWVIRNRVGDVLQTFDPAIVMTVVTPTSTFALTVGNGITLTTDEGILNSRATIQLTEAQSLLVPVGNYSSYELQILDDGNERILLRGRLIGVGGDNP